MKTLDSGTFSEDMLLSNVKCINLGGFVVKNVLSSHILFLEKSTLTIFDRVQKVLNHLCLENRDCLAESSSLYKNDFYL